MIKRAYPEYKPSGFEWLGEIPEHWMIVRAKYCSKVNMGQSPNSEDCNVDGNGLPFLQGNAEFGSENPIPRQYCDATRKIASKGDLLISVRAPVGALNMADQDYGIGRGLCGITPKADHLNSRFSWYLLHQIRIELNFKATGSTYDAVSANDVECMTCVLPYVQEQHDIATFLDRETARIDTLIEKKQRQIDLLQEKRAALISHAVTKGLNPKAKMKGSGIEWLGQVPAHWDIKRLRLLFWNLDSRRVPLSAEQRSYMEKRYPYYGASGIIDSVEGYIFDEPLILVAEDGANLLSRSTPLAFIAEGKYWVNNHAHILKPITGPLKYWESVLQIYDYTPLISGSAQPKLTAENLDSIALPAPPEREQRAIAAFLVGETTRINALLEKVQGSIAMLQEYRTSLISAAVTGKIDVRQEAA